MGNYTYKESIKIYKEFKYQETYEYKLIQLGYTKNESLTLINHLKPSILDKILLEEEKNELYYNIVKIDIAILLFTDIILSFLEISHAFEQ